MQVGDIAVSFTSPLQSSFEDILLAVFILKALAVSTWLYMKSNVCHRVPDDPKEPHSLWEEDTWDG